MKIKQWDEFIIENRSHKCNICDNRIFQALPYVAITQTSENKSEILTTVKCTKCETIYVIME